MAERSLAKRAWYESLRVVCGLVAAVVLRLRCGGLRHQPATGGALVLSNHQSHLDPVLVGLTFRRRLNYLARDTLFGFAPFRCLINSLDAIPIDREGLGLAGLKETLRRLKHGEMVLIFPEGTRSPDGRVAPLKPGFSALAKRARVALVPVGIDGAFQAWPRWQKFPGPGTVCVEVGEPITPDEAASWDERQLVEEVERRIRACHALARERRLRALGQSSADGADGAESEPVAGSRAER